MENPASIRTCNRQSAPASSSSSDESGVVVTEASSRSRSESTSSNEEFGMVGVRFNSRSNIPVDIKILARIPAQRYINCIVHKQADVSKCLVRISLIAKTSDINQFRRYVYQNNLIASPLHDENGRYRRSSPSYYRFINYQIERMRSWIKREVPNVLIDADLATCRTVAILVSNHLLKHNIDSLEYYNLLRPYFAKRTSHFIHELKMFARSPYRIKEYDNKCVYCINLNHIMEDENLKSSSSFINAEDENLERLFLITIQPLERKPKTLREQKVVEKMDLLDIFRHISSLGISAISLTRSIFNRFTPSSKLVPVQDIANAIPSEMVIAEYIWVDLSEKFGTGRILWHSCATGERCEFEYEKSYILPNLLHPPNDIDTVDVISSDDNDSNNSSDDSNSGDARNNDEIPGTSTSALNNLRQTRLRNLSESDDEPVAKCSKSTTTNESIETEKENPVAKCSKSTSTNEGKETEKE